MASREALRIAGKVNELTEQLVMRLTGLGADPNDSVDIATASEFAKENFRLHSFLSPNSHELSRRVEGLADKFEVCAQPHKAHALRGMTADLIGHAAAFRDGEDTAYAVLSLLLELSDSPTHATYDPPLATAPPTPSAPPTLEPLSDDNSGEESWSDYASGDEDGDDPFWRLDDDGDSDGSGRAAVAVRSVSEREADGTLTASRDDATDHPRTSPSSLKAGSGVGAARSTHPFDSVRDGLVEWYFRSGSDHQLKAAHDAAAIRYAATVGIGTIWKHATPLPGPRDGAPLVHESFVVRETCWMLLGLDTFLYACRDAGGGDGECIRLLPGTAIHGTSPTALASAVADFEVAGTRLRVIRRFVREHTVENTAGGAGRTRTHRALAYAYARVLSEVEQRLSVLERASGLQRLRIELHGDFALIHSLIRLHATAVACRTGATNAERVTTLLNTLHTAAFSMETVGESAPGMSAVALSLFVDAATPMFRFIDGWMHTGVVDDPYDEFPVVALQSWASTVDSALLPLWERFTLRQGGDGSELGGEGWTPTRQPNRYHAGSIVRFLHPVLNQILVGGKSACMLLASAHTVPPQKPSLNVFLDALRVRRDSRDNRTDIQSCVDDGSAVADGACTSRAPKTSTKSRFLPRTSVSESERLLVGVVDVMCAPLPAAEASQISFNPCEAPRSGTRGLEPAFHAAMTAAYLNTSNSLLSVLNREHYLLEHFEVLRKFFLFEAGGALHPVCLHVFETVPPSPAHGWDREAEYTDMIQKAVADVGHARHAQRVSVSLPKGRRPSGALGAIGGLRLLYVVPPPMDLLINRASLHVYSDAFSFLLQLKWAKWNLDTTPTRRGFAWSSGGADVHRALLLRWRLSRTVDAVHAYLLARLLDGLSVDFKSELASARDLDDVRALHAGYVASVWDQCLLDPRADKVRAAILKIADTGVLFRHMWDAMTDNIAARRAVVGGEQFARLERDFANCCQFLTTMLAGLLKNGAYGHMQALLDALQSHRKLPAVWT